MNIDGIIETSAWVECTIDNLIISISYVWQRTTFNLKEGSVTTKEMQPNKEQVEEWRKFATQTIHSAVRQALTGEK